MPNAHSPYPIYCANETKNDACVPLSQWIFTLSFSIQIDFLLRTWIGIFEVFSPQRAAIESLPHPHCLFNLISMRKKIPVEIPILSITYNFHRLCGMQIRCNYVLFVNKAKILTFFYLHFNFMFQTKLNVCCVNEVCRRMLNWIFWIG